MCFEIVIYKYELLSSVFLMVGVCRFCATICRMDLLMELENESHKICVILKNCFKLEIKLNDDLPNTVCTDCISTLEIVNSFYEKLRQSEESLRSIFKEKTDEVAASVLPVKYINEEEEEEELDNSTYESEYLEEYENEIGRNFSAKTDEEDSVEMVELVDVQSEDGELTQNLNSWVSYNWLCFLCTEPSTSYSSLVQHALQKHQVTENELLFRCADCHKTCARYFIFFNHVRLRHHKALSCCCDLCNLQCYNYESLAQHREVCSSTQQQLQLIICKTCGKAFRNNHTYALHERLQHRSIEKSFDCHLCNKKFKRAFALRIHERVHYEEKQYSCHICGHAFRQKVNLETHMYAHSTEKQYECAICKKCFKTAANLDKHGLTHTNIKEFQCTFCDKKFRTNDSRVSHERIHTGEKPYKCEYCEKSFRFRSTHLNHLNFHTGERPYKCEECDHQFSNCSNYNKHMKRRHKQKIGNNSQTRSAA